MSASQIQYINTDLVVSGENLQVLDKAFKDAGLLALGTIPPEYGLTSMGYETDCQHNAPEPNIKSFLSIIETLDEAALIIWNRCEQREFDIGYQCGIEPRSLNHLLSPELLQRIVAVGSAIRITLYKTGR